MKFLLIAAALLLSTSSFSQTETYKSQLLQKNGENYFLDFGLKLKVRNLETLEEQELKIMVRSEADTNDISESMLCLYASRLLNDHIRNAVSKIGKSFIFYQYSSVDMSDADNIIKIKILEGAQYVVSISVEGQDIEIAQSDRLLYFDK